MGVTDYISVASIIITALTPVWALVLWVVKNQLAGEIKTDQAIMKGRFEDIELKFKVIWEWMLEGALPEALDHGLLARNSPLQATQKAEQIFLPIHQELKDLYKELKAQGKQDHEIEMIICSKYDSWLEDNVCQILGLKRGSCVKTAMVLAKQ